MWRMLRMAPGEATPDEVDMLFDVTKQIEGHTICFWRRFILACSRIIRHFKEEILERNKFDLWSKKKKYPYLVINIY